VREVREEGCIVPNFPRFYVDRLGSLSIVHVLGDIDEANSLQFETTMRDAARDSDGPLIVSFVECTSAAATSLNVLVRQFESLGTRLSVVAPPSNHVRRDIGLMSRGTMLPIYDGFREAVLALCDANDVGHTTHSVKSEEADWEGAFAG